MHNDYWYSQLSHSYVEAISGLGLESLWEINVQFQLVKYLAHASVFIEWWQGYLHVGVIFQFSLPESSKPQINT